MEIQTVVLPIIALILSGVTWTSFGAFSNWRKTHGTNEWTGFNTAKLRDDVILGGVLGIGSVIYSIMSETLTAISTPSEFFLAIGAGFALVAAVDKFIVGGILGK